MEKNNQVITWSTDKQVVSNDEAGPSSAPTNAIGCPPGKRTSVNITRNIPGPSPVAHRTVDEVGMWEQFYTDEILTVILDYTNENIDRYILLNNDRIDFQNYTRKTSGQDRAASIYWAHVLVCRQ